MLKTHKNPQKAPKREKVLKKGLTKVKKSDRITKLSALRDSEEEFEESEKSLKKS